MKNILIIIGLVHSFPSIAQEPQPSNRYLTNTIDFLKEEPVSLFDWGIKKLRGRLSKLHVKNLENSEMVVVMVRFSQKEKIIYIQSEEHSPLRDVSMLGPKINRSMTDAQKLCKKTVIAIKEKLGFSAKLDNKPKIQRFYTSSTIGSMFSHEYADQTNAAYTGEKIMELIKLESVVGSSEGAITCNGTFLNNQISYSK